MDSLGWIQQTNDKNSMYRVRMVSIENEFHRGLLKQFFACLGKVIFHCPFFMSIKCTVDRLNAQQCTCL